MEDIVLLFISAINNILTFLACPSHSSSLLLLSD